MELRFFSLLLSLWTVLRLNPSSAMQWISQMQSAVMSTAKYYKKCTACEKSSKKFQMWPKHVRLESNLFWSSTGKSLEVNFFQIGNPSSRYLWPEKVEMIYYIGVIGVEVLTSNHGLHGIEPMPASL